MDQPPRIGRIPLPPRRDLAQDTAADPLSSLQAGLQGPDAEKVRADAAARLAALEHRLRQSMAAGHTPDEFAALAAATDACVAARELVQHYPQAR